MKPVEIFSTRDEYFVKIITTEIIIYGIDSNHNLWMWGWPPESDDFYDKKGRGYEYPCRVKFFVEKQLKVLDIETGLRTSIIKVCDRDNEENVSFYGIPHRTRYTDEEDDEEGDGSSMRYAEIESASARMLGIDL